MKTTATMYADDLLGLTRTNTPASDDGLMQFNTGPDYAYFTQEELVAVIRHLEDLARPVTAEERARVYGNLTS